MNDITLSNKEVKKMKETKKPGEPLETAGRAQEIQLSQLDDRILCQIDETVIQNVKAYCSLNPATGKRC